MTRSPLLGVLIFASAVWSCDADSDAQAGEPVEHDQFCARLAAAVCDGVAKCCDGDAGPAARSAEYCLD